MRTSPDIGADADPTTGFLEGYSTQVSGKFVYGETRIGGTSLSSPLIVGMQAVAEEAAGGTALGFANPAIYALYGTKAYNDVTDDPFGDGTRIAHVRVATLDGVSQTALATAGNAKDAHARVRQGLRHHHRCRHPDGELLQVVRSCFRKQCTGVDFRPRVLRHPGPDRGPGHDEGHDDRPAARTDERRSPRR